MWALCWSVFFNGKPTINNQRRAIRHEFESVGPTLLKNPLGAGWGILPTLQWVGS